MTTHKPTGIPRPQTGGIPVSHRTAKPAGEAGKLTASDAEWAIKHTQARKSRPVLQGPFRPSIVGRRMKSNDRKTAAPTSKPVVSRLRNTSSSSSDKDDPSLASVPQRKPPLPKSKPHGKSPQDSRKVAELSEHIHDLEAQLQLEKENVEQLSSEVHTLKKDVQSGSDAQEEKYKLHTKVNKLEKNILTLKENLEKHNLDPVSLETLEIDEAAVENEKNKAFHGASKLRLAMENMLANNKVKINELQDFLQSVS